MTGSETNGKSPAPEEDIEAADLIDTRRIDAISKARENADKALERFGKAKEVGELTEQAAHAAMFRSVRRYVRQLEGFLTSTDRGLDYWDTAEIGTWHIQPPDPGEMAWNHKVAHDIGSTNMDTPGQMPRDYTLKNEAEFTADPLHLTGLKSIYEIRSVREAEHTAEFHVTHHGRYTVRDSKSEVIPEPIIESYFRASHRFAADVGLDVHMKQEIDEHADPI